MMMTITVTVMMIMLLTAYHSNFSQYPQSMGKLRSPNGGWSAMVIVTLLLDGDIWHSDIDYTFQKTSYFLVQTPINGDSDIAKM